jgi:glutaredoxin
MNILYTSPKCTYCPKAKIHLGEIGLEYEERNVVEPAFREELLALGIRTVPTLVKGGKIYLGDEIQKLSP